MFPSNFSWNELVIMTTVYKSRKYIKSVGTISKAFIVGVGTRSNVYQLTPISKLSNWKSSYLHCNIITSRTTKIYSLIFIQYVPCEGYGCRFFLGCIISVLLGNVEVCGLVTTRCILSYFRSQSRIGQHYFVNFLLRNKNKQHTHPCNWDWGNSFLFFASSNVDSVFF